LKDRNDRYFIGYTHEASDYENTTKFLANHIKKTFDQWNDIAEEMWTMTAVDQSQWGPTLQISTDTDIDIVTRENKQYKMRYKADYDEGIKRKRLYNNNKSKPMPYCGRAV